MKISLFKLLSFSFPLFLFKIRGNILQFVVNWRRPRVIVNRLYTHASRNLSPPLCVLQSPATRNRSWLAEQRSRITSPSFISGSLLILRIRIQKKTRPFSIPSLISKAIPSRERKKIAKNNNVVPQLLWKCENYEGTVTCRVSISHPNPAISPLELFRREGNLNSIGDATSHRLVRPIDFSAINDTREFTRWCDISYLTRLVKYAATVLNCPEGERCEDGRSCQATNHTGKRCDIWHLFRKDWYRANVKVPRWWLSSLPFPPPSPVYFIIFLLFFLPFYSIRLVRPWIELNSA